MFFLNLHNNVDLCASSNIFCICRDLADSEKLSIVFNVQNFKYGNFDESAICAANAVFPLFGGPKLKFIIIIIIIIQSKIFSYTFD